MSFPNPDSERATGTGRSRLRACVAPALVAMLMACGPSRQERLQELRNLQAEGRYAESVAPLGELLDADPDDPELNHLYGLALFASESPGLAIWPLRKVVEQPDHSVEDVFLLAQALARGGAREDGIDAAKRVLEAEPQHVGALLLIAGVSLDLRRYDDVLATSDRVLELEAARPMVQLWRAKALAGLHRFDEADAALDTALSLVGEGTEADSAQQAICEAGVAIAIQKEDEQETEQRWRTCLANPPVSSDLVDRAMDFFDEREAPERATAVLEDALETYPEEMTLRRKLAWRLEKSGRAGEAERLLLEATRLEPGGAPAWVALGDLYRERGDYASAVHATEEVLRARDTVPTLMMAQFADDLVQAGEFAKAEEVIDLISRPEYASLLRGRMLLKQGEPAAALEELEQGLRLWPGNSTARMLAGQAAEKLGDFDRAIAEYRDSVRGDGASSESVFSLSSLYADEGNYSAALYIVGLRLRNEPKDPAANAEFVRIASQAGAYAAALAALAKLRETPGEERRAATAAATLAAARGGPAAAIAQIASEKLDLERPENADLLRSLVDYEIAAHREEDALHRAAAAVKANPDVASHHVIHALALEAAGRPAEEIRGAYEAARRLDPENAVALAGLARLEAEEGRVSEALALYDRAAALESEDPGPAWAAVKLAAESGREADVDERLEALLASYPRHAAAASLLAQRLAASGSDLDRAQGLARRALRFRGGAEALEAAGVVALARGEAGEAVRSLRRSLELRPDSPSTLYHLALALEATGDRRAALDTLRDALASEQFPEEEAAREKLAWLEVQAP